jgi:parallel beta-helix repeat protein
LIFDFRWKPAAAAIVLAMACASGALAAEVTTNGTGGGLWSDPATWRTKTVPTAGDSAVIASGDAVAFDRDDTDKITCAELYIDPSGSLSFKGGGKRVFVAGGAIESYGAIKIDATQGDEPMALFFGGDKAEKLSLKLQKGGSLLVYGRPGAEAKNAILASKPTSAAIAGAVATIDAGPGTMLDLQRTAIADVKVSASTIDNTGAKPNERIGVADCLFTGQSSLYVISCDTPSIQNNTFTYTGEAQLAVPAITVYASPLAEVRRNHISGKYAMGINGTAQTDSMILNNTIENCPTGIYWYGTNGMLKGNTIKGCDTGIIVTSMTGVIEQTTIDGAKTGVNVSGAALQCTNLIVTNLQKDGIPIDMPGGVLTLVNCDLKPEQVKLAGAPPKEGPWVQAMQYVVVGVKHVSARKPLVEIKTTTPAKPLAPGAMDPNVRNSPAPVTPQGVTPLPASNVPLMVKSWSFGLDGKKVAAPAYTMNVYLEGAKPTDKPTVLATQSITPQPSWYRAKPDDPTPTVEVTLP